jgi:hypothetical protein
MEDAIVDAPLFKHALVLLEGRIFAICDFFSFQAANKMFELAFVELGRAPSAPHTRSLEFFDNWFLGVPFGRMATVSVQLCHYFGFKRARWRVPVGLDGFAVLKGDFLLLQLYVYGRQRFPRR